MTRTPIRHITIPTDNRFRYALLLLREDAVILRRTDFGDDTALWYTWNGVIEEVDPRVLNTLIDLKAVVFICDYPVGVYELTARGMRYAFYVRQDLGLEPKDSRVIRPAGL